MCMTEMSVSEGDKTVTEITPTRLFRIRRRRVSTVSYDVNSAVVSTSAVVIERGLVN